MAQSDYDIVIMGGGFYGCCLALFLRSVAPRILLIEAGGSLLERASRVNQARVHGGFHYPRSFTTALRSRVLSERFLIDFEKAITSDFDMLYAISRWRSKVSSSRFARMFKSANIPLQTAPQRMRGMFDASLIEEVFLCKEFAFDWTIVRAMLMEKLSANGIAVRLNTSVVELQHREDNAVLQLADGNAIACDFAFNVTYAGLNAVIGDHAARIPMKYELAEIALMEPPDDLKNYAVTVMDGPFFSCMPYPSEKFYSLTHVRYTPHFSWTDSAKESAYDVAARLPKESKWRHMVYDAKRYLPCMADAVYRRSLFDVKAVLQRSEIDDGRPILLRQEPTMPRLCSVMGAKIDNIYDLFEALPRANERWQDANTSLLFA